MIPVRIGKTATAPDQGAVFFRPAKRPVPAAKSRPDGRFGPVPAVGSRPAELPVPGGGPRGEGRPGPI